MQSVLIITGMHRSGTSLTASLLQSAGVDLGQRLMGLGLGGNPKGHFEDLDFVEFHESVLQSQGISTAGWTLEKSIQVQEQHLDQAQSIIYQRSSSKQIWGWKDPRTTLFLKFWVALISEAKFVFVYRSPWEVVDSLYRRGDGIFVTNPNLALQVWLNYNKAIIDFYDQFSEQCVLLSLDSITCNPKFLTEAIDKKLGISLAPVGDIYDKTILHHQISRSHRPTLIKQYFPEVLALYHELDARAMLAQRDRLSVVDEPTPTSDYKVWALQDWLDVRRVERELKQSQSQLQQTQAESEGSQAQLQQTGAENEQLHSQLQQTGAENEQLHSQLQQTGAENEQLHSQLQQTGAENEQLHSQLRQTGAENEQLHSQLRQIGAELERSLSQLRQTGAENEQLHSQLQQNGAELERSLSQLRQIGAENEQLHSQLQQTGAELERSLATISGIESSKFWQLRTAWFRLKQAIGIKENKDAPANLAILGINHYREIRFKAASKNSSSGCFDTINGKSVTTIEVPKATPLTATGWAILPDEGKTADQVIITYGKNNCVVAVAPVNLARPDVAKALNNPAYVNSGWSITLDPSTLPKSKVELKAWAYNAIRREAIQLDSIISTSQPSYSFLRLKYLSAVLQVRGMRYALARLSKKVYYKLDNSQPTIEVVPAGSDHDDPYYRWLSRHFPREADLRKMAETAEILGYKPVISVIMPVFNPPERFLREAIESVLNQVYPYWELCIADDASTKSYVKQVLEEYRAKDSRIKVVFRKENGHISRASNSALEIATGEFVALLDHDDLLTRDALYEVALLLNRHPDADMIYSDEDKVDEDNKLKEPFFKPDWCPDSFLSRMYTCHLGTYRRSLVNEIEGFRAGFEGSQDYDFVLRLTEKTENIYHIPKILYHWRIHSASTAKSLDSKNYAFEAAQKALFEAIHRRGEPGVVAPAPGQTRYHIVRYNIDKQDLVSIIIPTKNLGEILDKCLFSIFEKTTYPNYEVILIDNGSTEAATIDIINKWKNQEPERFRCFPLDIPFNFSKLNNFAVKQAKGKYLLFLNNDVEILTPDWIEAMVEQAQRPSIGAVGALLLYPDDTIQHAGVVAGLGGVAGHSHKHFQVGSSGYFSHINTVNNFSAVTAACMMCRRDVFEEVGGFEEEIAVAFNDVDFCFKLVEKGYRNIYLPHVVLYHYESKSRGYEDTPEKLARFIKEVEYVQKKWKKLIEHDPCYSPNLTKEREDFSISRQIHK